MNEVMMLVLADNGMNEGAKVMSFEDTLVYYKPQRPHVFISYSRLDQRSLQELHAHLDHYSSRKELTYWDDTKIPPGARWRAEMQRALDATTAAILLVSPEFLASDFIIKNELPPLLRSASQRNTRILCVILRYCAFIDSNLSEFQAVNPPSQPLSQISRGKRAAVWIKVVKMIKNEAQDIQDGTNV